MDVQDTYLEASFEASDCLLHVLKPVVWLSARQLHLTGPSSASLARLWGEHQLIELN